MQKNRAGTLALAFLCALFGFLLVVELRGSTAAAPDVAAERVSELSARLADAERERDSLKETLASTQQQETAGEDETAAAALKMRAGLTPLEGAGVIVRLDDSKAESKAGENQNLYLIHDDDLLRVINELRAAGAEAIAVNGQRLTGTSEIRCAGPTLSVNNVRSAPPFEVRAIGDPDALAQAIRMRGGVADTLKVWGIQLELETSDAVYIPPYEGSLDYRYAHVTEKKEASK